MLHRYSHLCGVPAFRFLSWHQHTVSRVPYKSLMKVHAPLTPVAIWSVSSFLPDSSQDYARTLILTTGKNVSMPLQGFTCVRLQSSHLTGSIPPFPHLLTTLAFDQRRRRWFALTFCTASAVGLPPSFVKLRRPSPSLSLGFCRLSAHVHNV